MNHITKEMLTNTFQGLSPEIITLLGKTLKNELKTVINQLNEIIATDGINSITPSFDNIFACFRPFTSLTDIKVIIIGQDPFIGLNEATGYAFSVSADMTIPPSTKIFINVCNDIN